MNHKGKCPICKTFRDLGFVEFGSKTVLVCEPCWREQVAIRTFNNAIESAAGVASDYKEAGCVTSIAGKNISKLILKLKHKEFKPLVTNPTSGVKRR